MGTVSRCPSNRCNSLPLAASQLFIHRCQLLPDLITRRYVDYLPRLSHSLAKDADLSDGHFTICYTVRDSRTWLLRVGARRFVTLAGGVRALAALVDLLEFVFHLGQASPQLGVFRLEFGDPFSKLLSVVHDDRIMRENQKPGKRNCLTVTMRSRCAGVTTGALFSPPLRARKR
jgi:hypothetical protein